jgi:hypothetical protein
MPCDSRETGNDIAFSNDEQWDGEKESGVDTDVHQEGIPHRDTGQHLPNNTKHRQRSPADKNGCYDPPYDMAITWRRN